MEPPARKERAWRMPHMLVTDRCWLVRFAEPRVVDALSRALYSDYADLGVNADTMGHEAGSATVWLLQPHTERELRRLYHTWEPLGITQTLEELLLDYRAGRASAREFQPRTTPCTVEALWLWPPPKDTVLQAQRSCYATLELSGIVASKKRVGLCSATLDEMRVTSISEDAGDRDDKHTHKHAHKHKHQQRGRSKTRQTPRKRRRTRRRRGVLGSDTESDAESGTGAAAAGWR